jgi:hypothetical protein
LVVVTAMLVASSVLAAAQPVAAGCGVNITYVNNLNNQITVDLTKSKVRVRLTTFPITTWGTWARYDNNHTWLNVNANSQLQRSYTLTLGCSSNRQYKFYVDKGPNNVTIYKPSSTGVTTSNNITVTIN